MGHIAKPCTAALRQRQPAMDVTQSRAATVRSLQQTVPLLDDGGIWNPRVCIRRDMQARSFTLGYRVGEGKRAEEAAGGRAVLSSGIFGSNF
jgi:hypothetical protein